MIFMRLYPVFSLLLKNYESVGFRLYDRKPNETESSYTGDYLYYEIVLRGYEEIGKEVRI